MTHRCLDQRRGLSFGQPGGDPAVPEIMKPERRRQLRRLLRLRERALERLHAIASLVPPEGPGVVKDVLRALARLSGEAEPGEVLLHGLLEPRCHRNVAALPGLCAMAVPTGDHVDEPAGEIDVGPVQV